MLIGNADEPLYAPACHQQSKHRIYFTRDYISSALHEVAHWCIAGKQRRLLEDYGYWYAPDGRCPLQQSEFEKMEVKPQAIEWIFSLAAGVTFNISADNLETNTGASESFKRAVFQQASTYLAHDKLPPRAALFTEVLQQHYQPNTQLHADMLDLAAL